MIIGLAARFIIWPLAKKLLFTGGLALVLAFGTAYIKHCGNNYIEERAQAEAEQSLREETNSFNVKTEDIRNEILELYKSLGEQHAADIATIREEHRTALQQHMKSAQTAFKDSELPQESAVVPGELDEPERLELCKERCIRP